jgi:hypothetical protein
MTNWPGHRPNSSNPLIGRGPWRWSRRRNEAALGAAPGESTNRRLHEPFWSGRPGSNRRPLPWQGGLARKRYLRKRSFVQVRGHLALDERGRRWTALAISCCTFAARSPRQFRAASDVVPESYLPTPRTKSLQDCEGRTPGTRPAPHSWPDSPRLVSQSSLTPTTEEQPVRFLDLELGTGREQHPVHVERRGRGRMVALSQHQEQARRLVTDFATFRDAGIDNALGN